MATEVGIFELKTHLSELIERVERGESLTVTKRGRAVAELRPLPGGGRLKRGYAKAKSVRTAADFDAPLGDFAPFMP